MFSVEPVSRFAAGEEGVEVVERTETHGVARLQRRRERCRLAANGLQLEKAGAGETHRREQVAGLYRGMDLARNF